MNKLSAYFAARPGINNSWLAKEIGYDPYNMAKVVKGIRPLPKSYISQLVEALEPLGGLQIDGYRVECADLDFSYLSRLLTAGKLLMQLHKSPIPYSFLNKLPGHLSI